MAQAEAHAMAQAQAEALAQAQAEAQTQAEALAEAQAWWTESEASSRSQDNLGKMAHVVERNLHQLGSEVAAEMSEMSTRTATNDRHRERRTKSLQKQRTKQQMLSLLQRQCLILASIKAQHPRVGTWPGNLNCRKE